MRSRTPPEDVWARLETLRDEDAIYDFEIGHCVLTVCHACAHLGIWAQSVLCRAVIVTWDWVEAPLGACRDRSRAVRVARQRPPRQAIPII